MKRGRSLPALAELAALTSFAVAQPLFEVTGDSPDFFLFRGAGRWEIVVWALLVAFAPPLALWVLELLAGVWSLRWKRALHLVFVGGLLAVIALQVVKAVSGVRGAALLVTAIGLGGAAAALFASRERMREWVRFIAPAPLVFLVLFLGFSPASALVLPGGGGVRALAADEARPPLVIVVFDELPLSSLVNTDGRVEDALYPNFGRLAAASTWYRNATAVAGFTPRAVPPVVTGRFPPQGKVAPIASQHPDNLFTLLADSHDLEVFETLTALCPGELCEGRRTGPSGLGSLLGDGGRVFRRIVALDDVEEDPTAAWLLEETVVERARRVGARAEAHRGDEKFAFGHRVENQPARFADFVESMDGRGRPFHFLHLLLPHTPWRYLPDGTTYDPGRSLPGMDAEGRWGDARWPIEVGRQRHLLQTAYVDALLGEVLDRLESTGLWDRAAVVVTADHGYAFEPGNGQKPKELNERTAPAVAGVPLFVKAPGQAEGSISDVNAMLVDVVPTVARLLGVRIPWPVDGVALGGDAVPARRGTTKVFVNNPANPRRVDGSGWLARVLSDGVDAHVRAAEGPTGLFRLGDFGHLVGRPASELPSPRSLGTSGLDDAEDFARVERGSGDVPALVTGVVEGQADGSVVALSLNGRVAGTSAVWTEDGVPGRFAVLVPPPLLREGRNDVELFVLDGARLEP